MKVYNFFDIDSATLVYATSDIELAFAFAEQIYEDDGKSGFDDLLLGVESSDGAAPQEIEGSDLMVYLQAEAAGEASARWNRKWIRSVDRERWLLRLIQWGKSRYPWTQMVIVKGAFLLTKSEVEFQGVDYFFVAEQFGPYSAQVQRDLDSLVAQRCLSVHPVPNSRASEYRVTNWGQQRIEDLQVAVSDTQKREITLIGQKLTSKHWTDMLEELYDEFPDFAVNSVYRRKLA